MAKQDSCVSVGLLFDAALQSIECRGAVANPSERDVDEALEHLGYDEDVRGWAKKFYGLIYFSLANRVGCLDFLDGVHGSALHSGDAPSWLAHLLQLWIGKVHGAALSTRVDWSGGKLTFEQRVGTKMKPRTLRLGKVLHETGATAEQRKEFETRAVELRWSITADPREVAAMSYGRAWTSCMRPGGLHEAGPLSDVMAGSALILFFRPGADHPCGRELLRPAVAASSTPVIVRSGRTYGTAAVISDDELAKAIGARVGVVTGSLSKYKGIFSNVYDDYAKKSYDKWNSEGKLKAAKKLRKAWSEVVTLPEPLDLSSMTEEAAETENEVDMGDIRDLLEQTASGILADWHHYEDRYNTTSPADPDDAPDLNNNDWPANVKAGTPEAHEVWALWREVWEEAVNALSVTFLCFGLGQDRLDRMIKSSREGTCDIVVNGDRYISVAREVVVAHEFAVEEFEQEMKDVDKDDADEIAFMESERRPWLWTCTVNAEDVADAERNMYDEDILYAMVRRGD